MYNYIYNVWASCSGKFEDTAYRIIDSESDRLCSLQIIQCENVIATIIGLYLPFHDGSPEQI